MRRSLALRFSQTELVALVALHPLGAQVARERVDFLCQVSNGPHVVLRLREKLGKNAIKTVRRRVRDRGGRLRSPGLYQLTEHGRYSLEKLARENFDAA